MFFKAIHALSLLTVCLAQTPKAPGLKMQHAAMDELQFLVGAWSGHAQVWRIADKWVNLTQTETSHMQARSLI